MKNNVIIDVGIAVGFRYAGYTEKEQDAAAWLQILRAGHSCYGLDEILVQYRRAEN